MHRRKHIIQPVLPHFGASLLKRYFRFAKHRPVGPIRSAAVIITMAVLVLFDRYLLPPTAA
jgi:hypothetical protein